MSYIVRLKEAETLHDVAHILGFWPAALAYILYKKRKKYKHFEISKRSGGKRKISSPYPDLMNLQKRLSEILQDCIAEINNQRNIKSVLSHGFRRKYSIVTNAAVHRNRRYVLNIDLENYFETINFGRVRGFFIKNRNFELNPTVATVLAQIACFNNALPQGSPCSPVISNLITHSLDIRLAKLAKKTGFYYSRYADDLTFSTNRKSFSTIIAKYYVENEHVWELGKELERIIVKSGFSINKNKTRMQYKGSRQDVTGLIVNKKINVRQEYWRTARAMAHSLFNTGEFVIRKTKKNESGNVVIDESKGTIEQINGILSFIDSIDLYNKKTKNYKKTENYKKTYRELNSRENVYQQFLIYKDFYATTVPVIIFEGKTDNVYIKAAIRSLSKDFPRLSEIDKQGKVIFKIRFFKYTNTTDRISCLSGGTADLAKFIASYEIKCKKYKELNSQQPVIILIDNDSGAKSIYSVLKNKTGKVVDGSSPFYYVSNNLYVVPIPKLDKKDTMIEDYFDKTLLKTKIGGKSFNLKVPFNKKYEYGKHLFAEHVVKNNQDKINFKRFKKILDRIDNVLVDFIK